MLNAEATQGIIKLLYAAALAYGCFSDIKSLKIPNAVPLGVAALFLAFYYVQPPHQDLHEHLLAALLGFLLMFSVYLGGLMGAGDVKLISALMLWAGSRDGLTFLLVMTLIGGLFAVLLLILQKWIAVWPSARRYIPSRRLKAWATRGIFPYGIAICLAGLILMPAFFRVG